MKKIQLIFVTHNEHKLMEVQKLLDTKYQLKSLQDINFTTEIPETGNTFKENALIKAQTIYAKTKKDVFSDDSGLVVECLNGNPGIYSARYAKSGYAQDNIKKVLHQMEGNDNRKAYFICVICLIISGNIFYFEGKVDGEILTEIDGKEGFGYDPIFKPTGYEKSFAQMDVNEKNNISHRYIAMKKLNEYLNTI